MIPAYVYAPPYEANPSSPVLIWNAYAPSFHPNAQIDFCMNPLFHTGYSIHDRAMFYWCEPGVWTDYYSGDMVSQELRSIIDGL